MTRGSQRKYRGNWLSRTNWSLFFGSLIVAFVLTIAIIGPDHAPNDPTETNMVIRDANGEWHIPPFPAFAIEGFPLGTDRFGRDLYSQLLYAVRPTLILVSIVACVRFGLGLFLGMVAGWSRSLMARILDNTINGALTIPAIIVALAAIAATPEQKGVWAFIIGLSITGWADTAQLVRELTKTIREKVYIEAARALGANSAQILRRHLLKQIMPITWILFPLEISGTLMTTAGLGFLGYFIGGNAFIQITDTMSERISINFELGQMLATTAEISSEPWGMAAAGSMVFITVLGFNLMGAGLRQRLFLNELHNRSIFSRLFTKLEYWVQVNINPIIHEVVNWRSFKLVLSIISVITIGAASFWIFNQEVKSNLVQDEHIALYNPGGHFWASERHDPYGTLWTPETGPSDPQVAWQFYDAGGFTGGPVISANGILYITSTSGILYSLDQNGHLVWQTDLGVTPVFTPCLDAHGNIFIVSKQGDLIKVSQSGDISWHYRQDKPMLANSGPIVDTQGNVYYTIGPMIQAVSAQGEFLWQSAVDSYLLKIPRLNPTEEFIIMAKFVLLADDGSHLDVEEVLTHDLEIEFNNPTHFIDASGKIYTLLGNNAVEWEFSGGEIVVNRNAFWPAGVFVLRLGQSVGSTPNGTLWSYTTSTTSTAFTKPAFQWLDLDGSVIGTVRWPQLSSFFIGVDRNLEYFVCGSINAEIDCRAYHEGKTKPSWQLTLGEFGTVTGGAIAPGRLYVSTEEGLLFALMDIE